MTDKGVPFQAPTAAAQKQLKASIGQRNLRPFVHFTSVILQKIKSRKYILGRENVLLKKKSALPSKGKHRIHV